MRSCSHCQGAVPDDAARCPSCGSSQLSRVVPVVRPRGAPASRGMKAIGAGLVLVGLSLVGGVGLGVVVDRTAMQEPAGVAVAPAAQDGFDGVRARGVLRVAADPDAPPFLKQTGATWEGFEYAVMNTIAGAAGVPLGIVPSTWDELPKRLTNGEADLAIAQMTAGELPGLLGSVSYLQYSLCLVVPTGSAIRGIEGVDGRRVGLYDDPVAIDALAGRRATSVWFSGPGYFEALLRGELDAVVYDCPLARQELRAYPDRLSIVDDALSVAAYQVVAAADREVLLGDVSRVIRDLGNQGLLRRMEERWLGAAPAAARGRSVLVGPGDTLETIAARELGDPAKAEALYETNRDVIGSDRAGIYAGMRLRLGR